MTNIPVTLLRVNGQEEALMVDQDKLFKALREHVNYHTFEMAILKDESVLLFDENGLLTKQQPVVNEKATVLYQGTFATTQPVVGDVFHLSDYRLIK